MDEVIGVTLFYLDFPAGTAFYDVPPGEGTILYKNGKVTDFSIKDPKYMTLIKKIRKEGKTCVGASIPIEELTKQ